MNMHLWLTCSGTMPAHNEGQTRWATHHLSLFNPLRRAQRRELTNRLWKEEEEVHFFIFIVCCGQFPTTFELDLAQSDGCEESKQCFEQGHVIKALQ